MNEMIVEAAPTNAFEELKNIVETFPPHIRCVPDFISIAEIPGDKFALNCKAEWRNGILGISLKVDSGFLKSIAGLFDSLERDAHWVSSPFGPNWTYVPILDLALVRSPRFEKTSLCEKYGGSVPDFFIWIPEFVSCTGSSVYAHERTPNDLDLILRAEPAKEGFFLPLDACLALKVSRILQKDLTWNHSFQRLEYTPLWDLGLILRDSLEPHIINEPDFAKLYYKNWMLNANQTTMMEPLDVASWAALREAETGKSIKQEEYAPNGSIESWMPIEAKSWEELEELETKAMKPPAEEGTYRYICQAHWRKQSRHVDWMMEYNGFLIGYTLLDQIAGKTKEPITTLAAAKKEDAKDQYKIDWKKGEIKQRRIRGDTTRRGQIRVQPKRGRASPSRLSLEGATKSGVFHIIDRGVVEFGAQKSGFQEFFLSKGKLRSGRWLIRRIERKALRDKSFWPDADLLQLWETFSKEETDEKGWILGEELLERGLITETKLLPPGKPEPGAGTSAYWTLIQPEEPKRWSPYVLSKRAIKAGWLPSKGYSALPKRIRRAVSEDLRYWTMDRKQALEARRQLAEGKETKEPGNLFEGKGVGHMRYIESPEILESHIGGKSIFLAGGITSCPNWQKDIVKLLNDANLVLLNPRREDFPINDPNAALEQITWEFKHLRMADTILFYFPKETLCPIVLFELGAWSITDKPIFVGVHPEYKRRQDVEIQIALARPDVEVVYSLQNLAQQVRDWGEEE